ncbi:MAG: acetate kinase [Candidatus Protochlamydia sp.]|nr:acetate kinase [Candidatus Protochlamydia sp.]
MKILVVNAGSSSHKLSLYTNPGEEPAEPIWKSHLEWGRGKKSRTCTIEAKGIKETFPLETTNVKEGLQLALDTLWKGQNAVIENLASIDRIGHRVVHGGSIFQQPTVVNAPVKEQIRKLIPLAPLHNPANLEGIELMEEFFPSVQQIAVFDTSFHAEIPEIAKLYPVPYEWKQKGVQRYGFHGISHEYCAGRASRMLGSNSSAKLINCHLGNGASLCAIKDGKSIDTTMGLTPMEGLMMGTRCGSIDPGIVFYMMREHRMSPQELDYLLNFEAGLKGVGGMQDMRDLIAKGDDRSRLAVDMYIYRLKAFIAAMTASLGGLDALVFTAGVGENSSIIREKTCQGLAYLGIRLDREKNAACKPDQNIALADSPVKILVIGTQEEWMIARACDSFNK